MEQILDCHVHMIGDGSSGSGCRLNLNSRTKRFLAKLLCFNMGIPISSYRTDLDTRYAAKVSDLVESSSLDGAVILANDYPYSSSSERLEDKMVFYVPNDYVIKLSKTHKHFIPAISLHPGRPDAIDELNRLAERGAKVLKLLPNYHVVDSRKKEYKQFWQLLAQLKIPYLAHTGGEHTLPNLDSKLQDPSHLSAALDEGVTVIAAHAASKSGIFDKNYIRKLTDMVRSHENLYLDNSAFNIPLRSRYYSECLKSTLIKRLVHGSDLPVSVGALWPFLYGYLGLPDLIRCGLIRKNPLEKDYKIKKAVGFPKEVFTRMSKLLP